MNESNVNLSWLGLPAPKANEAPAEAQQPNHQADLGSTSGQSPGRHLHLFDNVDDNVGHLREFATDTDIREFLTEAGPYASKEACPVFSPGIFPSGRIKGRTPTEFTLVVSEHDAGKVGVDEAVKRLGKAGIVAFIYTSASHTPEHPRWRVVAPLKRPIGPDQYLPLLGVLNGALGGCLAPESAELKRRWFYGRVDGAVDYRTAVVEGRALDDLAAAEGGITPIAVKPPKPKTTVARSAPPAGPVTEADVERAISALRAIPNPGKPEMGYERWLPFAMALHAAAGGHPRALNALIDWTNDGQDERTTAIWNGFTVREDGIGPGTLFKAARDAGWVDPLRVPSAEGLEVVCDESFEVVRLAVLGACLADTLTEATIQRVLPLDDEGQTHLVAELREGGFADEAERIEEARRGARDAIGRAKARRFKSEPLAAFAQRPGIAWLIKHVLPRTGLAVIYGAPGSGKSFFALDMVATVARGSEWRGRKVRKGRAMYIAAEGSGGFASRGRAYLQAHKLTEIDLRVIGEAPNFFTGTGDEKHIAEEVRACGGADVIVIDTLSASSAGADENTGKDMNLIVGRMNELQAATGALVILIHHSGKDEAKGARGWSGLKAAVDTEIEVSRPNDEEPGRVARVTKQKDGESGAAFGFELEMVELGLDEDGDPIRSCVVRTTDQIPMRKGKAPGTAAERRPRGQWKRMAFDIAKERGTVSIEDVVEKVAAEMPAPEPGKRDQRRGNARRDIDALIRDEFLEAIDEGKSLRLAGRGELL